MKILTKTELARQDFVDNAIFALIQKLLPADRKLKWDIEVIGAVRDAIQTAALKEEVINRRQFYPYTKI